MVIVTILLACGGAILLIWTWMAPEKIRPAGDQPKESAPKKTFARSAAMTFVPARNDARSAVR